MVPCCYCSISFCIQPLVFVGDLENLCLYCNYYGFILFTLQSLLRGRFLRNNRLAEDERPASVAASELGLLRQRRTVSGLRYYLYYAVYIKQKGCVFLSIFSS